MSKEDIRVDCCCGRVELMCEEKHLLFLVLCEVSFGICIGIGVFHVGRTPGRSTSTTVFTLGCIFVRLLSDGIIWRGRGRGAERHRAEPDRFDSCGGN